MNKLSSYNSNIKRELAVVMPVYNEEACVRKVINSWIAVLSRLKINFVLIVINDGSNDNTINEIAYFQDSENIQIVNKINSGHGPTILMGYKKAIDNAEWVFQCDSDNEMEACHFAKLWAEREPYSAVFGIRAGRIQNLQRKFITMTSRFIVRTIFGRNIIDVNVPYRLIRSHILKPILLKIPSDSFAPNIIISGALSKSNLPVLNIPIPTQPRQTGNVSIMQSKLWKAAFLSLWQILFISCKLE